MAKKPQLEASLTDLSLSGALARPAGRLAQPTTFALPPAGSGIAPGAEAARWRLPGRAQAAITWERKHLTLEAATQYHLLCGGGRGRRLAINSLLRANSSPVLWNQTVLPPRGGRLHSVHSQRTAARLLSADRNCLRVFVEDIQTRSSPASCWLPHLSPSSLGIVYCALVSGASCCLLGLQLQDAGISRLLG